MTGLFLQKERSLAGGIILAAGHKNQLEAVPSPLSAGTPIFIGVGRHDTNYQFALKGLLFFRKLKAQVEIETWRGLGHEFPEWGSTGLKEWLSLRLEKKPSEQALEKELAGILEREDEFERWWHLIEFGQRPFVKALPEFEAKVKSVRLNLEKEPAIAREARVLKQSRRLLGKEIGPQSLKSLEEIAAGYAQIAEAAEDSPQGEVASKDYERVSAVVDYARSLEEKQTKPVQKVEKSAERTEAGGRTIPRNPLFK